jgi:hypothetical protein
MAIVNTGRKIVEVLPGQVWKSREKRGAVRLVMVIVVTCYRVQVRNVRTNRLASVHLQDFVARFDLESGT